MSKLFYPRLAISNIRKNGKTYIPYLGASIFTIAMFFIMHALAVSEEVLQLRGGESVAMILGFGVYVIGIFSIIVLFYINSFLMKQRKKELGLYNILGMEKKHIAQMLFFEMLMTVIISIAIGLLGGMLFSKLMYLVLLRLLKLPGSLAFSFTWPSFLITIGLFLGIFMITFCFNMIKIHYTNPIDLLKGGQTGEKEPKTKWILAMIGFLSLGIGYYLALTIESSVIAIYMFFAAVIFVIVGTYSLFIAGSIVILKLLRKNKKIYYQSRFFIAISGMIYRMKQHAVGLASICILSTMVLVTLTTTVSLYVGQEDIFHRQFPREYTISTFDTTNEDIEKIHRIIEEEADKYGVALENILTYKSVTLFVTNNDGMFENAGDFPGLTKSSGMLLIDVEDYHSLTGRNETLAENEVILYSSNQDITHSINIAGQSFEVVRKSEDILDLGMDTSVIDTMVLVVKNMDIAMDIFYRTTGGKLEGPAYFFGFDVDLDKDQAIELTDVINKQFELNNMNARLQTRQDAWDNALPLFGGFLFIGIFLGALFLMATGLILYYKHVSEGYEDKERFHIMQKVGMSKDEVKKSIRSQTLMVFFLPLLMAVIHIAFAFKMITKLLMLFNLTNIWLFFICMVMTIMFFTVIYVLLYRLTARAYYKIVN